jgi:hypothetical protein
LMGLGLGFVEGLRDLGEGVGEGLVPVHVRAAGAEFSRGPSPRPSATIELISRPDFGDSTK